MPVALRLALALATCRRAARYRWQPAMHLPRLVARQRCRVVLAMSAAVFSCVARPMCLAVQVFRAALCALLVTRRCSLGTPLLCIAVLAPRLPVARSRLARRMEALRVPVVVSR